MTLSIGKRAAWNSSLLAAQVSEPQPQPARLALAMGGAQAEGGRYGRMGMAKFEVGGSVTWSVWSLARPLSKI